MLVARREDRLRELAGSWAERHGVEAQVVLADLLPPTPASRPAATRSRRGPAAGVVVLNAGFGLRGRVWELERERQSAMVRLNCLAVVDLAAHVLPGMVARGSGALVVVSSAAAWQPVPYMATYAATKVFELHLAEALAEELRGTGVRALAICPGPTRTEFTMSAARAPPHWWIPSTTSISWSARPGGRWPRGAAAR